jgi:hypothetical protein
MLVAKDMDSLQSSSLDGINKMIPHHIDFYGVPLGVKRMLRDCHLIGIEEHLLLDTPLRHIVEAQCNKTNLMIPIEDEENLPNARH